MNAAVKSLLERPSRTKIVATLGPASDSEEMLEKLIIAGVDIFRINAAHGTQDRFAVMVKRIRSVSKKIGLPVGILMDLAGPKIRLGELENGELTLESGSEMAFVSQKFLEKAAVSPELAGIPYVTCTYEPLVNELRAGDRIVLADGTVELTVSQVSAKKNQWAKCRVLDGGTVRSRQGVNLPGVKLSIPAMLEIDRSNAAWAAKNGVDFLGLSFVRHAFEITDLKNLIAENGGTTQVVAKIEKPEALEELSEIVKETDAVMVARGDLGVETDIARVAVLQKEIIQICRAYRRPVIVATQMLESMTHTNLPTRAEVSDVANAILDGTDACMLSGESAVGEFPVETVQMMHRIALGTEETLETDCLTLIPETSPFDPVLEIMARNVCDLAEELDAKFIVTATSNGESARCLSANRCPTRIIALTPSRDTLQKMCLDWGVIPMELPRSKKTAKDIMTYALELLKKEELLAPGERIILFTDASFGTAQNAIVVYDEK
ncbi:MAG: pyruvate kinase [Thermoguttaceae bacterium]|nr:pyruvate kinase [Thermoguttaceae bacterium]